MLVQRMSLKRALKTIRKKRPNALPNKYFMDQLKELAKSAGSMEPSVYAGPPVRRRPTKIEEGEESSKSFFKQKNGFLRKFDVLNYMLYRAGDERSSATPTYEKGYKK